MSVYQRTKLRMGRDSLTCVPRSVPGVLPAEVRSVPEGGSKSMEPRSSSAAAWTRRLSSQQIRLREKHQFYLLILIIQIIEHFQNIR